MPKVQAIDFRSQVSCYDSGAFTTHSCCLPTCSRTGPSTIAPSISPTERLLACSHYSFLALTIGVIFTIFFKASPKKSKGLSRYSDSIRSNPLVPSESPEPVILELISPEVAPFPTPIAREQTGGGNLAKWRISPPGTRSSSLIPRGV